MELILSDDEARTLRVVYPADRPTARWLAYYAGSFGTVEVNNSYYRLPSADASADGPPRSRRGSSLPSRPAGTSLT